MFSLDISDLYRVHINSTILFPFQPSMMKKNQEPRTKNQEPRTKNQEPRTKNQDQKTRNTEHRTRNAEHGTFLLSPNIFNHFGKMFILEFMHFFCYYIRRIRR